MYFKEEAEGDFPFYVNMKMKKVLSATLASVIAISTLSPAFAANMNIQPAGYHHAYLSGVGSGRFEPARNITRAEAVVRLARLYYYTDGRGYSPTFSDTGANQWYNSYVGWAQAKDHHSYHYVLR